MFLAEFGPHLCACSDVSHKAPFRAQPAGSSQTFSQGTRLTLTDGSMLRQTVPSRLQSPTTGELRQHPPPHLVAHQPAPPATTCEGPVKTVTRVATSKALPGLGKLPGD